MLDGVAIGWIYVIAGLLVRFGGYCCGWIAYSLVVCWIWLRCFDCCLLLWCFFCLDWFSWLDVGFVAGWGKWCVCWLVVLVVFVTILVLLITGLLCCVCCIRFARVVLFWVLLLWGF